MSSQWFMGTWPAFDSTSIRNFGVWVLLDAVKPIWESLSNVPPAEIRRDRIHGMAHEMDLRVAEGPVLSHRP